METKLELHMELTSLPVLVRQFTYVSWSWMCAPSLRLGLLS